MEFNIDYLQRAKQMFGQERVELIFAVDEYLNAKKELESTIDRRYYQLSIERRFLNAGKQYISKINEQGNKTRNGKKITRSDNDRELTAIIREIQETALKIHPVHYIRLSEEFPEFLSKKTIISSPLESARNQKC